jgi:hypothetical protein
MAEFETALRDELMAAARRPPRRRGEKVAVAAVLVAFVAGLVWVGIGSVSGSPPAAADIHVSHEDGRVVVRLTDLQNTPEGIERATDKAGLDIEVKGVPAGPSQLGRFVGSAVDRGGADDVKYQRKGGVTFVAFSLPEHWPGELTLYLGQPAKPGEFYQTSSDAYAKGEPLACSNTFHRPLRTAQRYLRGYDVEIEPYDGSIAKPPMSLRDALRQGLGDQPITGATALSSTKLDIDVGGSPPRSGPEPATC